jgi:hypothetical protein
MKCRNMARHSQTPATTSRSEQITMRICTYYDLGVRFIGCINDRLKTYDLNTDSWSRLFDPSGAYEHYEYPEEDIIRHVLINSGRMDFIDGESDVHTHIRQRWAAGYTDVEEIVDYLVERRRQYGFFTTGINVELVMAVLRRMGHIV